MIRNRHLLGAALILALALPAFGDSASNDLASYLQQRSTLKTGDVSARVDLARWCRGREMFTQMADMCGEALTLDPANDAAYNMLREYDQTHTMPEEPDHAAAVLKELKDRFGRDFKSKDTRHFTIFYDTTDQFAAARGQQLEQAYNMFYIYFDMQKLRPQFLSKRLVSIVFKQYEDYRKYAKEVDGTDNAWAAGYYSGRMNRTAFYDDSTGPAGDKLEKTVADMKAQVADLNKQIPEAQKKNAIAVANDMIRQRNDLASQIQNLSRNNDIVFEHFNAVKTLHEATHQIAFNTGIQSRFIDYPLWLSEGLATSFEAEARDGSRGPAVVNTYRMETVKDSLKNKAFIPLKTFLAGSPAALDTAGAAVFYAQSWSMFHFLYRTDKDGMEKYLQSLLAQKPGQRLSPDQQLKLFTDAFGDDLDTLEDRWKKYLQGL